VEKISAEEALKLFEEPIDEASKKKRQIREIITGGGVRELRGILDLGMQLADAMLDPKNKLHPTPESSDDSERVRAARHFMRAAMSRLRGVKEYVYGSDIKIPDAGPQSSGAEQEDDTAGYESRN